MNKQELRKIPEIITVKIEKLSNLGLGIAKYDGFIIFVEHACPNDIVEIKIKKYYKSYAVAEIQNIVESSSERVEPFCKMQKVCGACQLQFIDYEAQLVHKKEIVEDTMKSIFGHPVEVRNMTASPKIREYRHKIQYPIGQTKNSKRILAGYYKSGTHELVNIKYCPIQPEYCDEIIDYIRVQASKGNLTGYNEETNTGELRHIVIRTSSLNQKSIVVLVINNSTVSSKIKNLAAKIYETFENVNGVLVNFNSKKTNLILGSRTELVKGEGFIEEGLCEKIFKVASKTFFQVNPYTADKIFRYIKEYISQNYSNPIILDAYAGITAFGICLSDVALKVVSIEEEEESVNLAKQIIKENNIQNIDLHCGDAEKFLANEAILGREFHVTILDPPRKGCSKNCLENTLKLTGDKIIYVSCNPATLARDLKYFVEHGATVEYIQPFDMFPHTYHIECVAIIDVNHARNKI